MIRKSISIAVVILCLHLVATFALAQDFQQSYRIPEGNRIAINNVAGDVLVQSYDGALVSVVAFKEGRDRDRLMIEDFSADGNVDVRVKYPQNCNCEATIRFEVRVPRAVSFNYDAIITVAGNIKMDDIQGKINTENVSGTITMHNVSGTVNASSFSGDVLIEQAVSGDVSTTTPTRSNGRSRRGYWRFLPFSQVAGSIIAKSISGNVKVVVNRLVASSLNRMEFSSVSGNVEVIMPDSLGAVIEMATTVGKLETDFPLAITKNATGIGGSARGSVGDGSRDLKISSISGNVALRKN